MKSSLDVAGFRVKVCNDLGGIGISYEEAICAWRYKGRVHGRRTGARIYNVVWVQCLFALLGIDDVDFSPQYDKFRKRYGVKYVIELVPSSNWGCTHVTVA